MDKGQTIVHRFQAGSLTGTISFLCPPVGQWTLEVPAAFFPRPGTMYTPQAADLKIMLDNEDPERRGRHGTSFTLAAYATKDGSSFLPTGLDTFPTADLMGALAERHDFRGIIVRGRQIRVGVPLRVRGHSPTTMPP